MNRERERERKGIGAAKNSVLGANIAVCVVLLDLVVLSERTLNLNQELVGRPLVGR
jgi:hypothetical protein